jgi:hypothetical protein
MPLVPGGGGVQADLRAARTLQGVVSRLTSKQLAYIGKGVQADFKVTDSCRCPG